MKGRVRIIVGHSAQHRPGAAHGAEVNSLCSSHSRLSRAATVRPSGNPGRAGPPGPGWGHCRGTGALQVTQWLIARLRLDNPAQFRSQLLRTSGPTLPYS
eukprot:139257-Hanusia_phi.AAC.1